jgi:ribosomal-protein-alanine N-acetyltransferase
VPDWSISPLNEKTIDTVVAIEETSFRQPWQRNSFVAELSCREALDLVVSDRPGGEVIAYACLRRVLEEIHLLKIAVAPNRRRLGVGTWLLAECLRLASAQGVEKFCLEVRPSNTAARLLYDKFGFRLVGKRPRYYADTGEAALVMIKFLKEEQ